MNIKIYKLFVAYLALLLVTSCVALKNGKKRLITKNEVKNCYLPRGYVCYKTTEPITIDGKMDEKAWRNAPWTDWFEDIEGDKQPKPHYKTRAKMLWDDKYIYVYAWLEEPHVWGNIIQHNAVIYYDNDFEVFIDPDGDCENYYEFEVNALNTTWNLTLDKTYSNGGHATNCDYPKQKSAILIAGTLNNSNDSDIGWAVEWRFAWKDLAKFSKGNTPPKINEQWRIGFSRVEWEHKIIDGTYVKVNRPEKNWVWSPPGVISMHIPEYWGYVRFTNQFSANCKNEAEKNAAAYTLLKKLHNAQIFYRKKNGSFAQSLQQLKADKIISAKTMRKIKMVADEQKFTISAPYLYPDKTIGTLTINTNAYYKIK